MTDPQTQPRQRDLWRYTLDFVLTGRWRELLDRLDTTTPQLLEGAVCFGLDYSPHEAKHGKGYLTTADARRIMTALALWEPTDQQAVIRALHAPSPCRQESGKVHWPINSAHSMEPGDRAWSRIFGIEAGWMQHDRAGFLAWTELGRNRYAAGESPFFAESSGQTAFAF